MGINVKHKVTSPQNFVFYIRSMLCFNPVLMQLRSMLSDVAFNTICARFAGETIKFPTRKEWKDWKIWGDVFSAALIKENISKLSFEDRCKVEEVRGLISGVEISGVKSTAAEAKELTQAYFQHIMDNGDRIHQAILDVERGDLPVSELSKIYALHLKEVKEQIKIVMALRSKR